VRRYASRCAALAALLLVAPKARADEPAPAAEVAPAPVENEPPCADQGPERKGVQKRDFLKSHRAEVSAWGGFFAGDLLSTSYSVGGAVAFYLTEDFGLETSLVVTPLDLGIERPLTQFFRGMRFHASNAFLLVEDFIWSPVHFKVRATDTAILHGDLVFALGAGSAFNETVQGLIFDAGIGLKFYPTRFLSIRFDVRDYLMTEEAISVQRVTNNLVGMAGLSFWILPWF
jgi:outer membrane beta-barrel protein